MARRLKTNGDTALINQAKVDIRRLEKEGKWDAATSLQLLVDTNERVRDLEERADIRDRQARSYPSITWLAARRPVSTMMFFLAFLLAISAVYINEVRYTLFTFLGANPELLAEISPAGILGLLIGLLVSGYVVRSRYIAAEEREQGE